MTFDFLTIENKLYNFTMQIVKEINRIRKFYYTRGWIRMVAFKLPLASFSKSWREVNISKTSFNTQLHILVVYIYLNTCFYNRTYHLVPSIFRMSKTNWLFSCYENVFIQGRTHTFHYKGCLNAFKCFIL